MSIAAHHAEWLALVPNSGPFLSVGVLTEAFPDGLGSVESKLAAELRAAYETWADPEGSDYEHVEEAELHEAFILFVLREMLGLDEAVLRRDQGLLDEYSVTLDVHDAELRPDAVVTYRERVRMLVSWVDRAHAVDQPLPGDAWAASPRDRMVEHLRETECPLGVVTDGERWTLVSVREGEAPGFATWWASLWLDERITLRALVSLLGEHRFFSVPEEETLAGLLQRSAEDQSEVTTQLGNQTLEAVEILIQRLDKLDRDRGGKLLEPVDEGDLYDAAVTVMMRLIFLFYAEENELLPVGEYLYLERYAASTLRAQLQEDADLHGEQVLETRSDAWPRLLATWRAVFAGVEHGNMRLAPYGGSLFDPDRYPFLEGRVPGSSWREEPANPLPVDNRTVLHLLTALQTLEERGHRRKLSFLALDVEQIGHVYEGMLDHTAARADGWVLGLSGVGGAEPEVPLQELEGLEEKGLLDLLKDRTNRGTATNRRWLKADPDEVVESEFGLLWSPAFEGDDDAAQRIKRFAKFLRKDSHGAPVVFPPGSAYVCDSSHRGATGTHYTPRALTEGIVRETLEPLVYEGPAEGLPENEWRLRSPEEILDLKVADPACGSGAFLVQACRYLAEKLVESRRKYDELGRDPTEEDLVVARREVAARCLYGVDKNPMAVEMAKMSLWLVTLAKDRPFSFVDHALGVGDSLFGLHDLDQLRYWNLVGEGEEQGLFVALVEDELDKAIQLRKDVEAFPVLDHEDAVLKGMLLSDAEAATRKVRALADLLLAPSLASEKQSDINEFRSKLLLEATARLEDPSWLERRARTADGFIEPFHWALAFPEVFERGGLDAIIGNPPFLGNRLWKGTQGAGLTRIVRSVLGEPPGKIDLSVAFHRRAADLLREDGGYGLLATSNIASGVAVDKGLRPISNIGSFYLAETDIPWPGRAAVFVTWICFRKGDWEGLRMLNGRQVAAIDARLKEENRLLTNPFRLQNSVYGFAGIHNARGLAFVVTPDDPWFSELRDESDSLLRPYVTGRNITETALRELPRWALDIGERSLDEIEDKWPKALRFLQEVVKPTRKAAQLESYKGLADRWWQFWNPRREQLEEARSHENVVVFSKNTKYVYGMIAPSDWIYTNKVLVVSMDRVDIYAILLSTLFRHWVRYYSGASLGEGVTISVTDAVSTYPLPRQEVAPAGVSAAALFHKMTVARAERRGGGLTDVANELNSEEVVGPDVSRLRELLAEVDRCVTEAYGWNAAALDHRFRPLSRRADSDEVFTISEEARLELLDRLGRLNLARYEDEVEQGLHGKKAREKLEQERMTKKGGNSGGTRKAAKGAKRDSRPSDPNQADIFGGDEVKA